jgi:uncharacterized membrane protein YgdD (TMEM256/DUF423 family)
MSKSFLITAAALGAISVMLGAFGAHGLKGRMNAETFEVFETAIRYQFYHVFALLAVGVIAKYAPGGFLAWSGRCFIAGIILFSGSLYLLAYLKMQGIEHMNWIGVFTPIGGLCFISGWILLAIAVIRS